MSPLMSSKAPRSFNFKNCLPSGTTVMRLFCLVESHLQDAAANAGVLSVYLITILYYHHHHLFIDNERENISCYWMDSME